MLVRIKEKTGYQIVKHDVISAWLGRMIHVPKKYREQVITQMEDLKLVKRLDSNKRNWDSSYQIMVVAEE